MRKMMKLLIPCILIILIMTLFLLVYNACIYNTSEKLGGLYEDISISKTTRQIPVKLLYKIQNTQELDYFYFEWVSAEYIKTDLDLDIPHKNDERLIISYGRELETMLYDINWKLFHYVEIWGPIGVPIFKKAFDPNALYIYSTDYQQGLYNGSLHAYQDDIRYIEDISIDKIDIWSVDNPSPKKIWWLDIRNWKTGLKRK